MTLTASLHSKNTPKGKQYYIRWREAGRQRHETIKGVYGKDALRIAAERKREIEQGRWYIAPPERLGTFLEGWLERQANHVKPVTLQRKRESLRALGVLSERRAVGSSASRPSAADEGGTVLRGRPEPAYRGKPNQSRLIPLSESSLDRLSVADVEDAHAALAARAPRQAQQALQTLKMALKDAERRGQRVDTALFEIKRNRYVSKEPRFLTWEEVLELQSWLPEHVCRIVPIAALTGLRQGELFELRESDLVLSERDRGHEAGPRLTEPPPSKSLSDSNLLRVRSGKTAASTRSVNLPAEAVRLLREQLLARRHTEGGYVFPAPMGGRWNASNFMHKFFRPARKRAGLEGVPFHALRHTFASLALSQGVPVSSIAGQLGHKDGGALLLRRYGHLYPGAGEAVAEALDAVVRGTDASGKPEQAEEEG